MAVFTHQEFLKPTTPRDLAKASLEAVKARNKEAWLAVYEEDGLVQDPVGISRFDATGEGHRGRAAIAAFWDVFMANQESFDYTIHHTAIGGDEVAAYATLHIGLKDGVKFECARYSTSPQNVAQRQNWSSPAPSGKRRLSGDVIARGVWVC